MVKRRATSDNRFERKEFTEALLAGEFERCHALLGHSEPVDVLAASRLAMRERRYVDVIGWLSRFEATSTRVKLERDVLLGAALGFSKDYVAGRRLLGEVSRALPADDSLGEDATYYEASIAWMEHEHRDAEDLISPQLSSTDANHRARAHIVLSWIALRRRDIARQIEELEKALDEIAVATAPDEYYRATALLTLALLCRELPLPDQTRRVRAIYDAMSWSNGLAVSHFQVTRFLGWLDALAGDALSAFRQFKMAAELAPSEHWRVQCFLDRAFLAKQTGERAFALDQLQEADRLASRLQWGDAVDEERGALLVLAELFSDVEPALAQQYLARFRALATPVLAALSYATDPRVRGFQAYSSGVAQLRLGNRESAKASLLEAWAIFEDFGYGWRAALCALHLAEATDEDGWLQRAANRIAPWPRSWIAKEIELVVSAPSPNLGEVPPAQRQVLDLLLSGKRNAEIAESLGRSSHTVRNQVAQLFQIFKVRTRAELVAVLARRAQGS
jgi:DNA-binding CsgD family transcriptional regulator